MKKFSKAPAAILIFFAALVAGFFLSPSIFMFITKQSDKINIYAPKICAEILRTQKDACTIFLCIVFLIGVMGYMLFFSNSKDDYRAKLYDVTPDISIPEPIGQFQHGSAWFLSDRKFKKDYPILKINLHKPIYKYLLNNGLKEYKSIEKEIPINNRANHHNVSHKYHNSQLVLKHNAKIKKRIKKEPFKKIGGGLVVAYHKKGHCEYINVMTDDVHSIILGSTGSGKSRTIVIQSIICQILAGESVFVSDIKGELYQYCCELLRWLDVNLLVLDYRDMSKSMSYNFLQPIIDKLKSGDENKAMQLCMDYANMIAGKKNENTEPLWHDGKVAVIAAGIMACTYDNMDKPMNQNLPYVYQWLTRMCSERPNKELLLNEYIKIVGEEHPANLILSQANVAPSKTRGSFYTSACTALSVFTDRQIYHICSTSDFSLTDLAAKKTALFVILPESKTTFYPLVSLLVAQIYDALDDYANNVIKTGRLPRRVHFDLDEFGNFSPFTYINTMLTVGRSKGIIFNFFLQSFAQLKEKYNDNIADIIKGNCTNLIYLKSTDDDGTNKPISNKLGKYTTSSYSLSSQSSKYNNSGSTSMNLSERNLLYPDELARLKRPYLLVVGDSGCKITNSPDLNCWAFNKMLGLGDKKHNEALRAYRQKDRPILKDVDQPPHYIKMWQPENFTKFQTQTLQKRGKV